MVVAQCRKLRMHGRAGPGCCITHCYFAAVRRINAVHTIACRFARDHFNRAAGHIQVCSTSFDRNHHLAVVFVVSDRALISGANTIAGTLNGQRLIGFRFQTCVRDVQRCTRVNSQNTVGVFAAFCGNALRLINKLAAGYRHSARCNSDGVPFCFNRFTSQIQSGISTESHILRQRNRVIHRIRQRSILPRCPCHAAQAQRHDQR